MSCQIEQIADCGDLSSLARALFLSSNEGNYEAILLENSYY